MNVAVKVAQPAILLLLLVWSGSDYASAEKLSVILPGQNTEFNIGDDHKHVDFDIRSSGALGLSIPVPPNGGPAATPKSPQLVLDAPPAAVPTSPPGINGGGSIFRNNGGLFPDTRPAISGLYQTPDLAPVPQPSIQDACKAETVILTSTAIVTSTRLSISQVVVPTTIVQDRVVTSTDIRYQSVYRTNYVTVQAPPQTRVETTTLTSEVVRSETVFRTSTRVQQQYFTTTDVQVRTQVVTSQVVEPTYITVTSTQIQYQPNTCEATTSTSTYAGYSYPTPGGSEANYESSYGTGSYGSSYYGNGGGSSSYGNGGGYWLGYQGNGYYGDSYKRPTRQRTRNKGIFGKWF
ncbi:mucin-5AC-like [Macrobrachium nipponense]|uniref:mucin-5AC-like n=1 Tax=Macrobrachium nipponense TaxID=159736 RepID=UPI0030C7DF5C